MENWETKIPIQKIKHPLFKKFNTEVFIQREDLVHPFISGNKWRKLKYNIQYCLDHKLQGILTFGGAHSNHIAATAYAGKKYGLKTIGLIRGNAPTFTAPTLENAQKWGMELIFLTREVYQKKHLKDFEHLLPKNYTEYLCLPEGGANELGLKGTQEIIGEKHKSFDAIFCAVGTGNTLSGIITSSYAHQKIYGVNTLKGAEGIRSNILQNIGDHPFNNWELLNDYHLGGYAKFHPDIITCMNFFKTACALQLDPIYTAKMMHAFLKLLEKNTFQNQKVLCIHTGGHQGTAAFFKRYQHKIN